MSKLLDLKQKRATAAEQAKQLAQKQVTEKRELKPDEQESFDRMMTEIRAFNGEIQGIEREEQIDAAIADKRAELHEEGISKDPEEVVKAYRKFLRFGDRGMTDEERTAMRPLNVSQNANSYKALDLRTGNPQSVITGNLGEYTVPVGFYAKLVIALKYYGGMLDAGCFELTTDMGNDLQIPTVDDTAQVGAIFAENTQVTTQEIIFGQVIMKAFKYSSKVVLVPMELLQDSGIDIESYIIQLMAIRIARILNTHMTVGTGSGQPRGVTLDTVTGTTGPVSTPWSGGGAGTSTGGFAYADLVNTKYSVNRAYRTGARWMMNDNTLAFILGLHDSNGRPFILDYLTTLQENEPEKILGDPIVINNDMPNPGSAGSPLAGNNSVIYGAFNNYWIRKVMGMIMLRLVERYADIGQIGFIGFLRQDGRMVNAGQNPIKGLTSATS